MPKFLLIAAAAIGCNPLVSCANADDGASIRSIESLIDAQTIFVGRIDIAKIDVASLGQKLTAIAKIDAARSAAPIAAAQKLSVRLKQAGVRQLYIVGSLADLPESIYVLVPLVNGADEVAIGNELQRIGLEIVQKSGGALFAGRATTWDRLAKKNDDHRADFGPAFAQMDEATMALAVAPTTVLRRALNESFEQLPAEFGNGPVKVITQGVMWAALGVQTKPNLTVKLAIKSESATAANALNGWVTNLIKKLAALPEKHRIVSDRFLTRLLPTVDKDRLTLEIDVNDETMATALAALAQKAQGASDRMQTMEKMKHLGLAFHQYFDRHKSFPPAARRDRTGKPLLSWRVLVLPYLAQEKLYAQFHLDEPWDSEHNKKLIPQMPAIFHGMNPRLNAAGKTTFVVPIGENAAFTGAAKGVEVKDIPDGLSNTIFLVDCDDQRAVDWTRPDDLPFQPAKPLDGLSMRFGNGFGALFGDGSVRFIKATVAPKTLVALFTRNGADMIDEPQPSGGK